ncbi:MAG: 2OG-Fe(II) oxygenase family protein [Pseudomonadota bacterium]|nr:2OG-Fe(II) oxygenase family protein [Pseudomonadota bacterium]
MDEIEGLFPIPLMRSPGLLDAATVAALTAHIRDAHLRRNTNSDLLSHTEIIRPDASPLYRRVAEVTTAKVAEFGTLLFGDRLRWSIKEMWTNVLEHGGGQSMHGHANSFVSGIVYLTPSHPSAHTVFLRNPGSTDFTFRHNTKTAQIGPFNAGKYVTPEIGVGDLILFPSYLLHEVPRNQGGQRITLAFNAIPDRLDSWGYTIGLTA